MKTVAALFVDPDGVYSTFPNVDMWPESRDARRYTGSLPVVCHSPCNLWVNMAAVNWKRYGRQCPAWYPGGTDGGCFASALASVRKHGGVLEHPAGSHAWRAHQLIPPPADAGRWEQQIGDPEYRWENGYAEGPPYWVCEVWQHAYGHGARKRTWLLYCGKRPPFELRWDRQPGTHQVGWFDRNKPTLSKKAASATPQAFAEELIRLAEWSAGE